MLRSPLVARYEKRLGKLETRARRLRSVVVFQVALLVIVFLDAVLTVA